MFELSADGDEYIKFDILEENTRFLLLAGKPLNEPVAHQGPFVLNEKAELMKAFDDYQKAKNGFEGVHEWQSSV